MKNKKLIISLIGLVFVLVFFSNIINPSTSIPDNSPNISQETTDLTPVNFSIYINGNWSVYVEKYDWCSGNGTEEDPYIIEGIHVTNENMTAHVSIETAEHFIIRNCTISNYAAPYGHHIYAGIYIEKGEYGLIENCTIINCSRGISMYEAKDSLKITNNKFIGSHNDSKTGGNAIVIQEAKGVNISYNDIFNYYSGIIVKDAEEIYIENNRIETNFGYTSDTGVYFVGVNNSEITNNDFYGCEATTQDSDGISISGDGDSNPIILENCYNIKIYGNRFFDSDGNQIGVSTSAFIDWQLIFGIILVLSCAIIFGYLLYIHNKKK